jgi:predicted nucleic acid-binding protein
VTVSVVDTSVASLMFQKRLELASYEPHLTGTTVYISFQTVVEMRLGALNRSWGTERTEALEAFLASLVLVEYTDRLGRCWARIMHEARSVGKRLEAGDARIAATALLLNAPLLTHDKDFSAEASPSITVVRYSV